VSELSSKGGSLQWYQKCFLVERAVHIVVLGVNKSTWLLEFHVFLYYLLAHLVAKKKYHTSYQVGRSSVECLVRSATHG